VSGLSSGSAVSVAKIIAKAPAMAA
jgi:hypothetical protein